MDKKKKYPKILKNDSIINAKMASDTYFYSFDFFAFLLIFISILARYGILISYSSYVTPFLGFAPGTLYMMYGYLVLRDGADLRKNIKHAFIVFAVMFVVCFALATAYMWFFYGTPFAYLTPNGIFNFLVLNYWGPTIGDYIWYVQSILYALVLCWLLRKLKKYDVIICIVLFVVSFFLGEGSQLINFNILGYTYIPGNFLTRTLPYMLLGRIIYRHDEWFDGTKTGWFIKLIVIGLVLSIVELYGLSKLGKLGYYGHLMGFILISFGIVGIAVSHMYAGQRFVELFPQFYRKVFFVSNPIGELVTTVFALTVSSQEEYIVVNIVAGTAICALSAGVAYIWHVIAAFIKKKTREKIR